MYSFLALTPYLGTVVISNGVRFDLGLGMDLGSYDVKVPLKSSVYSRISNTWKPVGKVYHSFPCPCMAFSQVIHFVAPTT